MPERLYTLFFRTRCIVLPLTLQDILQSIPMAFPVRFVFYELTGNRFRADRLSNSGTPVGFGRQHGVAFVSSVLYTNSAFVINSNISCVNYSLQFSANKSIFMSPLRRHIFVCFMAKSAFWRGFSALAPYTGVGPI